MSDEPNNQRDDTYRPADDPKLTAYALGELDADEAREIEARLKDDEPSREAVQAIRRTAELLSAEFATELSEGQDTPQAPTRSRFARWRLGLSIAAAAMVLIAIGVGLLLPSLGAARRSARRMEPLAMNEYRSDDLSLAAPQSASPATPDLPLQGQTYSYTPSDHPLKTQSARSTGQTIPPGAYPAMPGMMPGMATPRTRSAGDGSASSDSSRATEDVDQSDTGNLYFSPSPRATARRGHPGMMMPGMMPGMYPGMPGMMPGPQPSRFNTNAFEHVEDNEFIAAYDEPLSTFSIDVDTASYAIVRRFISQHGQLPPPGAVRIEEMINYFDYAYPQPEGYIPFSVTTDVTNAPWREGHQLVRIGLKGRDIDRDQRGPANLVFLIDVSGSMKPADKLPLLKRSLRMLVDELNDSDRIAIVVYASASGLVLPSTPIAEKETIHQAIDNLEAGGSTNGGAGIELAYRIATEHFNHEGVNRVILATDGDFNVGMTDRSALVQMIEHKRESGVFLSVLGFGLDNLKDATMEKLADKGNGNYAYIDSIMEGHKVLVRQAGATLIPIAKDVKIQVEFNPAQVASYRLIGYENRMLNKEDFNDDRKDAGEIGAGHTVTALYEIIPVGALDDRPRVDGLRYQPAPPAREQAEPESPFADELLLVKLRYKLPDEDTSRLIEHPVMNKIMPLSEASRDVRFAAAVAEFGMILRHSPHKGRANIAQVIELAIAGLTGDEHGDRRQFVELVERAAELMRGDHRYSQP